MDFKNGPCVSQYAEGDKPALVRKMTKNDVTDATSAKSGREQCRGTGEEMSTNAGQIKDIRPSETDWTELNEMISNCHLSGVKQWFHSRGLGANARQLYNINTYWPLQTAAKAGNVEIMDVLLEYGFDPLETEFFGDGLLHTAAAVGHVEMVERLLRLGLFVSMCDDDGNTPLHFAADAPEDNAQMIEFLTGRNADPNARNKFDETPLHAAALKGSINNVRALLASGACVSVESPRVASPLFYAVHRKKDAEEHVKALCDNGAVCSPCPKFCVFNAASTLCGLSVSKTDFLSVISLLVERNFCLSCRGFMQNATPLYNISASINVDHRDKIIHVIIEAGYDVGQDFNWINDLSRFPPSVIDRHILQKKLLNYATTPKSLRHMSCLTIRKILGPSLPSKLDCLPLPDILKNVVRLKPAFN